MTRSQLWKFAAPVLLFMACAITVTSSLANQGDMIADRVLGQIDFNHNAANLIRNAGFECVLIGSGRHECDPESALRL
jgi:hypothetical protein